MDEVDFLDGHAASKAQLKEAARISERFFRTKGDSSQMKSDYKLFLCISRLFPEFIEVISAEGKVIGSNIFLPCTKKLRKAFLGKEITEAELAERIMKEVNYKNFDCIYWAEASILEGCQHHALFLISSENILKKVSFFGKKKLPVFFWAWSEQGRGAGITVFRELGRKESFIGSQ